MRGLVALASVLSLSACASAPSYTFRADRAILHGSVQKHVRHAFEGVAGVGEIAFDPGESSVTVRHDGTVTPAQVDRAIRGAGLWTGAVESAAPDTIVALVRGQEY